MREDPIGPEFYGPLGTAERISDITFYLAAILSIAVLLVDKTTQPKLYGAVQATFAVTVIGFFVSGIVIKTYFAARAQSGRFADFVSNAFSVPLVTSPSKGYYNSSASDSFLRVGSTVLETELKMHGAIDSTEQTLKGLMKSLSDLYLKKVTRPTCNNQEFRKRGIPTS